MNFAASPVLELTLPVWRSRFLHYVFVAGFGLLLGRAVYLQGLNNDFLQAKGESRYSRLMEVPANRGRVLDRNGEALAISTPVKSIWAIPGEAHPGPRQLARLAVLLEMPQAEIEKRLADTGRDFVFVKRQISPEVAERVASLHIPGLFQNREYRRYYPSGDVMAHVLGFTGADDIGQEGVELAFQERLAGKPGSRRVIKDRLGQTVEDIESIKAAQDGNDLTLALDARIQNLAFSQLKAAVAQNRAKAGGVVVLDIETGELLALANFPTYNPNNRSKLAGTQLRNRAVTDTFEPGSTLKPFTIALALEAGRVRPESVIQTAPGTLSIGGATIRDAHVERSLTVAQVIQKSSNVGAARRGTRPRVSGRGRREGTAVSQLAADRAGDDVLRTRHRGLIGAARARLQRVRARRRAGAPLAGARGRTARRSASHGSQDGGSGSRDAGDGSQPRRYRTPRPDRGLSRGRQDGYRSQAGKRRVRG